MGVASPIRLAGLRGAPNGPLVDRAAESVLRRALHIGEFDVWFQPVMALDSLTVRGVEALLRRRLSRDPEIVQDASAFIAAAEATAAPSTLGAGA